MAKNIGGISVAIIADSTKFIKGMVGAQGMLRKFGASAMSAVKTLAKFSAGLGAVGAAGLTYFTKSAMESIDVLAATADKLGITTESLAGLQLAAHEANIEQETLNKALTTLTKNTSAAAAGVGAAQSAYQSLGIDAKTLNDLSPDQQLFEIAGAMGKVRNQQDQLRIATQLFGGKAADMVRVLRGGRGALEEAAQAAKDLGLAVDRESARGVERALDAYDRFKAGIQGIFRQIAITVAPVMELLSVKLTNLLATNGAGAKLGQSIGQFAVEVFKRVGDGFQYAIKSFLEFIADLKQFVFDFRKSSAGYYTGLGYKSPKDEQAAKGAIAAAQMRAQQFGKLPWFSSQIDSLIKDANNRRINPEGDGFMSLARDMGDAIVSKLVPIGRTASNFGMAGNNAFVSARDALAKFWSLNLPGLLGQKSAMDFAANRGNIPNLAFAQVGSADSYRQQAAIRRQGEVQRLDKTRNVLLTEIRDAVRKNGGMLVARAG